MVASLPASADLPSFTTAAGVVQQLMEARGEKSLLKPQAQLAVDRGCHSQRRRELGRDCPSNRARPERGASVLTADDVGRAAVGFLKVAKLMTLWLAII